MTGRGRTVAVVGASSAPHKFGNKAVRAYLRQGWTVYPVNPNEAGAKIEGLTVYPSLAAVPGSIDRVSLYVPPAVGITLLDDIKQAAPKELFLNPGTESDELVARAEALGLDPIQACSIVDIGERP
jgi:predicted CoA-binding protein